MLKCLCVGLTTLIIEIATVTQVSAAPAATIKCSWPRLNLRSKTISGPTPCGTHLCLSEDFEIEYYLFNPPNSDPLPSQLHSGEIWVATSMGGKSAFPAQLEHNLSGFGYCEISSPPGYTFSQGINLTITGSDPGTALLNAGGKLIWTGNSAFFKFYDGPDSQKQVTGGVKGQSLATILVGRIDGGGAYGTHSDANVQVAWHLNFEK